MRAIIQRVQWAQVQVGAEIVGQIRHGLLVYSGIAPSDSLQDVRNMAQKIVTLRIFEDEQGKMNRSVRDARGGVLAVSNFTLLADARKGRRRWPVNPGNSTRRFFSALLAYSACLPER